MDTVQSQWQVLPVVSVPSLDCRIHLERMSLSSFDESVNNLMGGWILFEDTNPSGLWDLSRDEKQSAYRNEPFRDLFREHFDVDFAHKCLKTRVCTTIKIVAIPNSIHPHNGNDKAGIGTTAKITILYNNGILLFLIKGCQLR